MPGKGKKGVAVRGERLQPRPPPRLFVLGRRCLQLHGEVQLSNSYLTERVRVAASCGTKLNRVILVLVVYRVKYASTQDLCRHTHGVRRREDGQLLEIGI